MDTQDLNRGLNSSFKIFGASLDALDIEEIITIKRAYLYALSSSNVSLIGFKDPYSFFQEIIKNGTTTDKCKYLGRFRVDSWLCPKPNLSDKEIICSDAFKHFLFQDGFKVYSDLMKQFVDAHIFPEKPIMIGVDHSLTGGVLTALSKRVGIENLCVIVFDAHTDAVPLDIRSGLVEYARDNKMPSPPSISLPEKKDLYTAGNFLFRLIQMGVIDPCNLIIVGPADSSDKYQNIPDKRVMKYVEHYEMLKAMGVTIIGRERLKKMDQSDFENALNRIKCSNLYISLDVDVSAQCGVLSSRFIEPKGSPMSLILDKVLILRELILNTRFSLVGFDVMEIDIYKVGVKLQSGIEDLTWDFIQKFTSMLIDLA